AAPVAARGARVIIGSAAHAVHGNSMNSTKPVALYILRTAEGAFSKWGITDNPLGRYDTRKLAGRTMTILGWGTRKESEAWERFLYQRWPGPDNNEVSAGTVVATAADEVLLQDFLRIFGGGAYGTVIPPIP